MTIPFFKYQVTGNDFVMIDNRSLTFPKTDKALVARLCDRKFGIGGDGLILLEHHDTADFRMIYYNADGNESTMCGNGGRCLVAFAKRLGVITNTATFEAIDGMHTALIKDNIVELQMQDVACSTIKKADTFTFLDTGSPHHVQMVENLSAYDVFSEGRKLRNGELYGKAGSNINFIESQGENTFSVRTYERGVEDETLSCGTGVTAVAIAMHELGKTKSNEVTTEVEGGTLRVRFTKTDHAYTNVFLIGPGTFVFKGEIK